MFKKTWFTVQRWILIAAIIIVILLAFYLWSNRYTPNTRNAYLNAYVLPITTQVPGKVVQVFVKDNIPVKRGQPLFEIDPQPYLYALNEAKAQYDAARQKTTRDVVQAKVNLAKWRLNHTIVRAPADGIATNLHLRPGQYANLGDPLFSFIETHRWWVVANFKETNLSLVKVGQPAAMSIDMYPGKLFTGTVTKIERGVRLSQHPPSGYLPYIPSSTDWVKLAQRIPVRITITDPDAKHYPFTVGSSAHVVVFTPQSHGLGWLSKAWLHVINRLGYL